MFDVSSRKSVSLLSRRTLKYSKTRNIVAVCAIILTAVLFTSVFSIGMSMIDSFQRETMRQVGTEAHGGFKFLTQKQYDILAADEKVQDISYNIFVGIAENPELNKTYTEIRYTEEKAAKWSFNMPETGTLPKEKMDIATTTAVLDALGVPHTLGTKVPLEFTVNGVKVQETFTLCGYWEHDAVAMANEAFLSRAYTDETAPVWQEVPESFGIYSYEAGSVNSSLWFNNSWNLDGKIQALKARCGFGDEVNEGTNWAYAGVTMDFTTLFLLVGILLLILLSGYLIIYNIFYISVSKDIQFYGLLKTIGTTNRQLRKIVRHQAMLLCAFGIPVGLAAGYALSYGLVPVVFSGMSMKTYIMSANPVIFVGGAVLTVLTVLISCIKPCVFVSHISAVEAVRYTEGNRNRKKTKKTGKTSPCSMAFGNMKRTPKKTISVVLSLSLSMILLHATITVVKGFDMNKYLENNVISDFYVTDASIMSGAYGTTLNGVSDADMEAIKANLNVTQIGNVYMRETLHALNGAGIERANQVYETYKDELPMPYAEEQARRLHEENVIDCHLYGVNGLAMDKLEIADGVFDEEKFKSGNYVIASAFKDTGEGRYYDIGDKVTIDYGDGKTKEYEVMAIGNIPFAAGPKHTHYFDVYFTMYGDEFTAQTGETGALDTIFNVEETTYEHAEKWMENYCEKTAPTLNYKSRTAYVREFQTLQNMFLIVGGMLSIILALIGILNFINSMITSVQARRRELAVMQSIGMTGKQLKTMLISEGVFYALFSVLFTVTIGSAISYGAVTAIAEQMWYFTYHFDVLPILYCVPILLVFSVLVPVLCYKNMCQSSIVERLRINE